MTNAVLSNHDWRMKKPVSCRESCSVKQFLLTWGLQEVHKPTDIINSWYVSIWGQQVKWLSSNSQRSLQSSVYWLRYKYRTYVHNYQKYHCCCCSLSKSCPTLCNPRDCSTSGFPILHYLPKFAQTHVHWVNNSIQPSHPLSPPSPPALSLSQHQGLFQWASSSSVEHP